MSAMHRIGTGAVAAVLLLAGCSDAADDAGSPSASASTGASQLPTAPMGAQDAAKLESVIASTYSEDIAKDFPALWVGVWDPEKGAYTQAWGEAVVGGRKATVDDVFRIGSVTKTVTATIILELIDEGKLSLDDTVANTAPKVAETHPDIADLTIRQLLSMTSGIPDYMNVPDGVVAGVTKDPTTVWTADQLIDAGIGKGLKPAGTGGYSTTNYILLQEVAEEITGTSLQDLIAQRITGPLGMANSALPPNEDTTLPEPAAHGYLNSNCIAEVEADGGSATEGQDTTDWNASYGQGGGGMQATITDLGRWGASGLGNTLLADATAAERMKTAQVQDGLTYGLGISDYGDGFVGHSGEALGWQTQVAHNPDTGLTVAMGTNACAGADLYLFDAIRSLVSFTLYPPVMSPPASPAASS